MESFISGENENRNSSPRHFGSSTFTVLLGGAGGGGGRKGSGVCS